MEKGGDKLPVTFMVMTYNQARFVAAAVESALAQDYAGPLEVLISDDASTDGTDRILRTLVADYDGPHNVRLNVNRHNLGLIPHLHKVFAMARHDFVVCGAGDDISRGDRVSRLADLHSQGRALLLHSATDFMDADGMALPDPNILTTFSGPWTPCDVARSGALFIGASAAYHKDLLRIFGPIIEPDAYEDLVFGFRAALLGRIAYCDEPLVRYRVGEGLSKAGSTKTHAQVHTFSVLFAVLRQRLTDAKGLGLAFDDPVTEALRETLSAVSGVLSECRKQMHDERREAEAAH